MKNYKLLRNYLRIDSLKNKTSIWNENILINIYYEDNEMRNIIEYDLFPFYEINKKEIPLAVINIFLILNETQLLFDNIFERSILIPHVKNNLGKIVLEGNLKEFHTVSIYKSLDTNTVICFSKKMSKIFIYQENIEFLRIDIRRVLGFQLDLINEYNGFIPFHASSTCINDNAIIICGNKKSGKSTIQLRLLASTKFNYMSNERTFLKLENGKLYAKGWLGRCNIGVGTISCFPYLRKYLPKKYSSNVSELWNSDEKIFIHPREIAKIGDGRIIRYGNVKAIVFPKFERYLDKKDIIIKINKNKIKEELLSTLISATHTDQIYNWLNFIKINEKIVKNHIKNIIKYIQKDIPCYEYFTDIDDDSKNFITNFSSI